MTLDTQILRKLDEAKYKDERNFPGNIMDLSIQDRSIRIARDIESDDIDIALKRITFFIFADTEYKAGEYIHRLILNRCPNVTRGAEQLIAPCLYLLPMISLGRLARGEYDNIYEIYFKKSSTLLSDNDHEAFKETTKFYNSNSGQLGILSYLY